MRIYNIKYNTFTIDSPIERDRNNYDSPKYTKRFESEDYSKLAIENNKFPYDHYFKGDYKSMTPTIMDRRAGISIYNPTPVYVSTSYRNKENFYDTYSTEGVTQLLSEIPCKCSQPSGNF